MLLKYSLHIQHSHAGIEVCFKYVIDNGTKSVEMEK